LHKRVLSVIVLFIWIWMNLVPDPGFGRT